jgi:hypothetical protein
MKIYRLAIPIPFEENVNTLKNKNESMKDYDGPYRIDQEYSQQKVDNIEKRFPNAKPIGFGNRGIAYDLGDKILKITTDWSEIYAANKLIKKPKDTHVTVFEVNEKDNYIILEKITPLTTKEKNIYKIMYYNIYGKLFPQSLRKNNSIDPIEPITIENFIQKIKSLPKNTKGPNSLLDTNEFNTMAPKFVNFINKLEANQLDPMMIDIHEDNVGKDKNGNFKILDLGMSL